jgi:hypothetical protein
MRQKIKYILFTVILLLLVAFPLALQYQTGSIGGTVVSRVGPIPGAFVEVRNVMSGAFLKVKTDVNGHYEVTGLRPGQYSLWVETPDHVSVWIPRVFVERGKTTQRDIAPGPPIT